METTTDTYPTEESMVHLPLYDSDTGIQVGDDPVQVGFHLSAERGERCHLFVTSRQGNYSLMYADYSDVDRFRKIAEMVNTGPIRKWQLDHADVTVEVISDAVMLADGVIEWEELTN